MTRSIRPTVAVLTVATLVTLNGCGGSDEGSEDGSGSGSVNASTPEEAINSYFEALDNEDWSTACDLLVPSERNFFDGKSEDGGELSPDELEIRLEALPAENADDLSCENPEVQTASWDSPDIIDFDKTGCVVEPPDPALPDEADANCTVTAIDGSSSDNLSIGLQRIDGSWYLYSPTYT